MSEQRNLLDETVTAMKEEGYSPENVRFVMVRWNRTYHDTWFTWEEFRDLANKVYDAGWGGPEVAESLKVVGADWWLERHEYDGSEWWEYKTLPARPDSHQAPPTVFTEQGIVL